MVEKPEEGICSRCDSENLEFHDDGSGRCLNCGRSFRWVSKEDISPKKGDLSDQSGQNQSDTTEPQHSEQVPEEKFPSKRVSGVSRTNGSISSRQGYTPSKKNSVVEKPKGKGFLWVGVLGIVLMMIGYIFISLYTMEIGLEEHHKIIQGLYMLLTSVGVLLAGIGMLVFGSVADHLDEHVRKGLIISAAILIALYLGIGQLSLYVF